jgi:hypothetical protein
MDALDRKRHFFQETVEKVQRAGGGSPGIQTHHLPPRTVINGRVLVKRARDLADIHLNPVARHRPAIALRALTHQSRAEALLAMLDQHTMKGVPATGAIHDLGGVHCAAA